MILVPYSGMTKRKQKEFDSFVEAVVGKFCSGIAINITDIPRVFNAARDAWDGLAVSGQPIGQQEALLAVRSAVVNKYRELAKGGA